MAEGDGRCYQCFVRYIMEADYDLDNGGDTIKVALVTGHVPSIHTHEAWTAVSGDEVTGTGYTAGGETLAGQTVGETGTGTASKGKFDGTDVTWTGLNIGGTSGAPSHAIMYDDTITAAPADRLIAYWEVTTSSNGGDYTLAWHTAGIITISV